MPIYEYACNDCGTKFESLRPIKEADRPIECKQCHSQETHRKMSTFFAQSGGHAISGTDSKSCSGCGGSCSCGGNCGH